MSIWKGEPRAPLPVLPLNSGIRITSSAISDDSVSDVGAPAQAFGGARITMDHEYDLFGTKNLVLMPPPYANADWYNLGLDSKTLQCIPPTRLMDILADFSPEVSRALWDFLRLCNPGWTLEVYKLGSKTPNKEGEKVAQKFLDQITELYGSVDIVFGRMNIGAFLRGAFFTELIFDDDMEPIDIATPDPATARFERRNEGHRGMVWQLGQMQKGQFVELDRPTVRYLPIDPFPGNPYGRPITSPAMFTSLFLLGLLHDLRRIIAQQGYPRIDIAIDAEVLMRIAPSDVKQSSEKFEAWINKMVEEVKKTYGSLQPTDAYVHISAIKIQKNVGTIDTQSMGSVGTIMLALERMAIRALKTMPIMMASMDQVSEANANRQWEIHVAGVKAVQHLSEAIFERYCGLSLQAAGIQGEVKFRFAELRSAELLRDAQTETLQIANETAKWAMGWTDQDEASLEITGHKAVEDEPRIMPKGGTQEPTANPVDVQDNADQNPTDVGDGEGRVVSLISRGFRGIKRLGS